MRGILMIEPLYNQVIKGNKSQTRRSSGLEAVNQRVELVVDEDNHGHYKEVIVNSSDEWDLVGCSYHDRSQFEFNKKGCGLITMVKGTGAVYCKPRYKIGEILFLKEPYVGQDGHYTYLFDFKQDSLMRRTIGWKNKMFMAADAGRNFIKITGIRCERLLDISDQDCIDEGIEQHDNGYWKDYGFDKLFAKPKESFISLYVHANKMKRTDKINNIWVFAYTFEYITNYQHK